MELPVLGWRELIIIGLVVAAVYLLAALLRLGQLKRRRQRLAALPPAEVKSPLPAKWANLLRRRKEPKAVPGEAAEEAPWLAPSIRQEAPARNQASAFGEQLFRSGVEAELQQLRSEVASLKEELKLMKAARRVSPQYNEAMMLAQRGMDATSVAEQCGISVGEAELVLALSRNKQEYEDYGDNDPPWSASN